MSQPEPAPEGASSLPRRATPDPGGFLIPEEHLPPGFAERVGRADLEPVPARPAATVVLAREGAGGVEALLLRRPQRSAFAADAWVFPGGTVDPADRVPELAALATGPSVQWWARRLGVEEPVEAAGYLVAALREAWEETGILLAHGEPAPAAEVRAARSALLRGDARLAEALARLRLRLAADDLLYIAHWVTPLPELRRYDTRFFLARVGPDARCDLEGEELVEAAWVRPADAVAAWEAGTLRLLPPTAHTLRRLAGHADLPSLWEALRDAPVPTHLPRMRLHPEGVLIEI